MELCSNGSLRSYVRSKLDPDGMSKIKDNEGVKLIRGASAGMTHMHQIGIIHKDIKPANILLSANGTKLADFGLSKDIDRLSTGGGTANYAAPEVLLNDKHSKSSDVWAMGCSLFYVLSGTHAFLNRDGNEAAFFIRNRHWSNDGLSRYARSSFRQFFRLPAER